MLAPEDLALLLGDLQSGSVAAGNAHEARRGGAARTTNANPARANNTANPTPTGAPAPTRGRGWRRAVVVHVGFGAAAEHAAAHIPGAWCVDTEALEAPPLWQRRSPTCIRALLQQLLQSAVALPSGAAGRGAAGPVSAEPTAPSNDAAADDGGDDPAAAAADNRPPPATPQPSRHERAPSPAPATLLVVYGADVMAAYRAAAIFHAHVADSVDVRVLDGGLRCWQALGLPLCQHFPPTAAALAEDDRLRPAACAACSPGQQHSPLPTSVLDPAALLRAQPRPIFVGVGTIREFVAREAGLTSPRTLPSPPPLVRSTRDRPASAQADDAAPAAHPATPVPQAFSLPPLHLLESGHSSAGLAVPSPSASVTTGHATSPTALVQSLALSTPATAAASADASARTTTAAVAAASGSPTDTTPCDWPPTQLVCVRSWQEHVGEDLGYEYINRAGRIPGAIFGFGGPHRNFLREYRTAEGRRQPLEHLERMWRQQGLNPSRYRIIFYCGTAWRASEAFWCARQLWPSAWLAVYDGGWAEWSRFEHHPVAVGNSGLSAAAKSAVSSGDHGEAAASAKRTAAAPAAAPAAAASSPFAAALALQVRVDGGRSTRPHAALTTAPAVPAAPALLLPSCTGEAMFGKRAKPRECFNTA